MRSIGKIKNLSKKTTLKSVTTQCIDEANEGQRVDNYLISQLKKIPKSHELPVAADHGIGPLFERKANVDADAHLAPRPFMSGTEPRGW